HHRRAHAGSLSEEAREKQPVHHGGAAAADVACREIAGGFQQRGGILADIKRRRKGIGTTEPRGSRPHGGHVIRKPERIRPDERAAAADAPRLMKEAAGEALAARNPAENEGFRREEPRAWRDVEAERAHETRAIEQNRFLRQPFEPCAALGTKAHRDARIGAWRAVDFLRRGRCNDRTRALFGGSGDAEAIAASKPARGGEESRHRNVVRLRRREQHAAGGALIEARQSVLREDNLGGTVAAFESEKRTSVGRRGSAVRS